MATFKLKGTRARAFLACIFTVASYAASFAQNGVTAINSGTTSLGTYATPVSNLCLAIGALVGIVGGLLIYIKWNRGDHDIAKDIMGWLGSCIFLILVSVIIKAFF